MASQMGLSSGSMYATPAIFGIGGAVAAFFGTKMLNAAKKATAE